MKLDATLSDKKAESHDADYLRRVGERVREARARRGMTRKLLARDSGVSERYLAQLESGHGNGSILLLRQIARAMGLALDELVRDGPDRPIEFTLLIESLRRLDPAELAAARRALGAMFGGTRERGRRIALVGLRGGGKSTLGAMLARDLGVPFIELDREIERIAGASLGEIFDLYGQAAYRRYERRALEIVLERHDQAVIATGGSIVAEPGTYDLLLTTCYTVWLTATPEEHMARVMAQSDLRPMAGNAEAMADLRRILAGRDALYAKADARVDTAGTTIEASFARLRAAMETVTETVP
jgi:XRE family transcriptional regulator, aerobic/anaerobic benzoate catabolism transcriptional regulator